MVLYTSLTKALVAGKSPAYLVIQGLPLVALTGKEVCRHHLVDPLERNLLVKRTGSI